MFKTVIIAALGFAAASAQFLTERDLQTASFTTLCTFASGVDSCTSAGAAFCCARYTRAGAAPAAPFAANVCVHSDFIGQTLSIGGVATAFTGCLNTNATITPRTACTNNTGCGASQCCTNVTVSAGAAGGLGTASRLACVNPTTFNGSSSTYAAAAWNTGFTATVALGNCTANPAATNGTGTETGSFGSYIKASVMMVLAAISVAMF